VAALPADDGTRRMVAMDESWWMFSHLAIAAWMQQTFKLSRASGTMNVLVMHRLSDLASAGAAGSHQVRLAEGLLADTETRVTYGQPPSEVDQARELLGLADTEARLAPDLPGAGASAGAGREVGEEVDRRAGAVVFTAPHDDPPGVHLVPHLGELLAGDERRWGAHLFGLTVPGETEAAAVDGDGPYLTGEERDRGAVVAQSAGDGRHDRPGGEGRGQEADLGGTARRRSDGGIGRHLNVKKEWYS
jgi:hypothetical protein